MCSGGGDVGVRGMGVIFFFFFFFFNTPVLPHCSTDQSTGNVSFPRREIEPSVSLRQPYSPTAKLTAYKTKKKVVVGENREEEIETNRI